MRKLLFVFFLASCAIAWGQSLVRYGPQPVISISSSTSTPYLVALTAPNQPVIAVCNSPANGVPCTNYATTYTSAGVACPNGAQDTPDPQPSNCQATTDASGNIGFWAFSGTYAWTACVPNSTTCYGPYTITLGGSGSGSFDPSNTYIWTLGTQTFNTAITFGSSGSGGSATFNGPTTFSSGNTPMVEAGFNFCFAGGSNCATVTSNSLGGLLFSSPPGGGLFFNSGSVFSGTISFGTGLGGGNLFFGPTDGPLQLASTNNQNVALIPNGTGITQICNNDLGLDASCFSGATLDVKLNKAMGFLITNGGGTLDTRALPVGTLSAQFNAGAEGPHLVPTPQSGGLLTNGHTYRFAYTLNSPGCNPECSASEEGLFVANAPNNSFTVGPPPFPGNATSWNLYATGNGQWSEVLCFSNIPIGSSQLVTSVAIPTVCPGTTSVPAGNESVKIVLPPAPTTSGTKAGGWSCNITTTDSSYADRPTGATGLFDCVKRFDRAVIEGAGAGLGSRFTIQNSGQSTVVNAIYGTDTNPKKVVYGRESGFRVDGSIGNLTGTPLCCGSSNGTAVCDIESYSDSSQGNEIDCSAGINQTAVYSNAVSAGGNGTVFSGLHGDCSNGITGCTPFVEGGAGDAQLAVSYIGGAFTHSGPTKPEISVCGGAGTHLYLGNYMEGTMTDGATQPEMDIGACGNVGPVIVNGLTEQIDNSSGSTAPMVQIESNSLTSGTLSNLYKNGHSKVLVNDLINGITVQCPGAPPCMYAGPYVFGNGANATLPAYFLTGLVTNLLQTQTKAFSTLPACSSTTEGDMRAVTDSTTATWGATITGGGANHVLAYCDGTNWTVAAK